MSTKTPTDAANFGHHSSGASTLNETEEHHGGGYPALVGGDPEKTASTINPPAASGGQPPQPQPPPPPPDGGLMAWLQVACSWSILFNTWGLLNTFGIFQTYYESGTLFQQSSSNIAWIGSIQAFLLLCVGSLSGPIFDRGHLRSLLALGSFLIVLGFMMTSLSTQFYHVVLAQGFCIGLGGGLIFIPGVAILPTYFRARLGLAVGLSVSGSSMGGVIYPIVFYRLVDRIGFGWATRVLGFIALATLIVPCLFMKMRIQPAQARSLIDVTALRDPAFVGFVFFLLLGFIGLYVVIFYISYLGVARGFTDQALSFYLIPILNAASVFGRTLPNALSDIFGPFNLLIPGVAMCAVLVLCLLAVSNTAGIIAVTVFFGFFSGVFIGLPPVIIAALTPDKALLGTRMGMAFFFLGSAVLIGGPGGGGVLGQATDPANLNWNGLWIFGGVMLVASTAGIVLLRLARSDWKLAVKI